MDIPDSQHTHSVPVKSIASHGPTGELMQNTILYLSERENVITNPTSTVHPESDATMLFDEFCQYPNENVYQSTRNGLSPVQTALDLFEPSTDHSLPTIESLVWRADIPVMRFNDPSNLNDMVMAGSDQHESALTLKVKDVMVNGDISEHPMLAMQGIFGDRILSPRFTQRVKALSSNSSGVSGSSRANSGNCRKRKRRARFSSSQVCILSSWLQEHLSNPYPEDGDKTALSRATGLTVRQVEAWFARN